MLTQVSKPSDIGFDSPRVERAFDLLRQWTDGDNPALPGASLTIGRNGRMMAPRRFGRQGPEPGAEALRSDGLFLLASVTKPVTCLGAMLLVERGLLNLNDPVVRHIPEFAAHGKEGTLVHHLFTHTSGLPDMLDNNLELRRRHAPLDAFVQHTACDAVPLFRPGTGFSYQSMGTLMLGEIVRRISGRSTAEFLQEELFDPLGLRSTALGARGFDRARLVRLRTPESQEPEWDWNSVYWQELGVPWGGMFSVPEDLAALCQWMLDGGVSSGRPLMSRQTLQRMTENRLRDLPGLPESLWRARPWGLGWQMNHPGLPDSLCDLLGAQVYGHHGSTGTLLWIDPASRSFFILLTTAPRDEAPWRLLSISNIVAAALM